MSTEIEKEIEVNHRDSKLIINEAIKEVKELSEGLEELKKLVQRE